MSANAEKPNSADDIGAKSMQQGSESDEGHDRREPSKGDCSIISVKTFKSPKGNIYRITKTNEVDDYQKPAKPGTIE